MTATAKPARRIRNGTTGILDSIWDVIRKRGLKVGDQLPSIRELAGRLDVKQSVVREAFLKAETMGWIKVLPRAGAFLRTPIPTQGNGSGQILDEALPGVFEAAVSAQEQNLFHLLDARRVIEIELVGRAAERRRLEDLLPVRRALEAMLQLPVEAPRAQHVGHDIRFHLEIARLSGNHVLVAVQSTLLELLRPHLVEVPRGLQRRAITDRSHAAIYEALVAGDGAAARTEMRAHLSLAYDGMLRDLQQVPAIEG